jgi:hypothetical protein
MPFQREATMGLEYKVAADLEIHILYGIRNRQPRRIDILLQTHFQRDETACLCLCLLVVLMDNAGTPRTPRYMRIKDVLRDI